MKKAEAEKRFVAELKAAGLRCYGKTYERGHYYWFFDLKNNDRRYWTDLSEESQKELGIA